ncbi:MAG: phage tail protein [Eubacteriales bacterium]|nr:phage tail protein [Eubacteriales bacterium]
MAGLQYSVKKNRLSRALLSGMSLEGSDALVCDGGEYHTMVLRGLDSTVTDCPWGRLFFSGEFPEDSVCYLYAAATNEKVLHRDGELWIEDVLLDENVDFLRKKRLIEELGGLRFIHANDVLLYELEGRFLWIMIEVIGRGGRIDGIKVQAPGDNFMGTFPEIYREKNSFFHRYLSVFSTIYNEFQEELDHRERLVDAESAPEGLLEIYARWLGLDVNGAFMEEELLRSLIREAGWLLKRKGTKKCLERLCELMVGERPVIVERSRIQEYVQDTERAVYDRLYGDSPYDVTLLIQKNLKETEKNRLLHLLRQFKPVRSRLRVVFLQERGMLDAYGYLDGPGRLWRPGPERLDSAGSADGMVVLE